MSDSTSVHAKARKKPDTTHARARLVVVEDEQDLQDLLRYNLEREGYAVACAESGEKGLRLIRADPPDLILLDLMLPGMDGLEICRALKADPVTAPIPILMVTAKSEEADIVTGLELGADDYVVKPFSPRVLVARVKAVLRRRSAEAEPAEMENADITIRNLVIRPDRHEVLVKDHAVDLTATEFRLLHLMASKPGRVFTRQQIIEAIHGKFAAVTDRSVDVQVVMLRRKLDEAGEDIQTVRGVGYRFKE